jgi:hypothetical protein
MAHEKFREVWEYSEDGQSLCALINGDRGFLMYLREEGDTGFTSRNPDYVGASDATLKYVLSNGQEDEYPLLWALPLDVIERALQYFKTSGMMPEFIQWHDDSK